MVRPLALSTKKPPADAEVVLVFLDEVTGFAYNTTVIPMQRLTDGRWSAETYAPAGALVRYRYARQEPELAEEVSASGEAILYRVARITGPGEINDIAGHGRASPSGDHRTSSATSMTGPAATHSPR
jgi:hypothetical protein